MDGGIAGNLDGSGYGDGELSERGAAGEGRGTDAETTLDSHALWSDADSTPLALAEVLDGQRPTRITCSECEQLPVALREEP